MMLPAPRKLFPLLVLFVACCPMNRLQAQPGIWLSLEPNLMLSGARIVSQNNNNYLSRSDKPGVSLSAGYQFDLPARFFISGNAHFLLLRNAVNINYPQSGFNNFSEVQFEKQTYAFDYVSAGGLALSSGYKITIGDRRYISVAAGAHIDFAVVPSQNDISAAKGGGQLAAVYYEQPDDDRLPRIFAGLDAYLAYNFQLGRTWLFAGLHYSVDPGQAIKGHFRSFPDYNFRDNGAWELRKSYLGLSLGIHLPKK